ncbi:2-acyl-glycerophospho-ethanolamine acyltransferase [Dermatophilus congolensis]|uniref:2-acyl-glycerophospho-ethanolamine acyltransferase n=2 Tax=Dermatophilus congolensis TaxID=1863 RepID=A0AA46BNC3_9MICO|nr:2-acyl-glycerophospho-ethanolamine acyltransferase [Dermatophilus congolensis]
MLYWTLKRLLGPVLRTAFRMKVHGLEKVPTQGPAILASNHLSFSDSIFLPVALPRRITFPAKLEYFTQPGLVGAIKRGFFTGVGQIPIDRSGGPKSAAALEAGLEVLSRDELFGIYPEGTRSPDGRLYKGKTGMVRMAMRAGVPIIPVAMIGTDIAQPTGQKIPKLVPIEVRFGDPIHLDHLVGKEDDQALIRAATDQVMQALADLSGQEYVHEYAADRKKFLQEQAARSGPKDSSPAAN